MKIFNINTLSKKISLTVIAVLTLTLSTYLIVFFINNDAKVNERIKQDNDQLSEILIESIRISMASGADDVKPFEKNLEKFDKIEMVKITPTEFLDLKKENALDKHEEEVSSANPKLSYFEKYNGKNVLLTVNALTADESCISCHDVSKGEVLAIVSIRQSLDVVYDEMLSQKFDAAWMAVIASIITFLAIFYFVNERLGKPIRKLTEVSSNFSNGKFDEQIEIKGNDELSVLGKSFNDMAEKIDIQLQYLNNLPIPVIVMDKEFNINYINSKGSLMFGKERSQIIGTKCYDNLKSGDCNSDKCICKKAMMDGETYSSETTAKGFGKDVPILYSGAQIKNRKGEVIGVLETVTDLSKSKEEEEYLKRSTKKILIEMEKLSQGDLTVSLESEKKGDTIDDLFNGFNKTISKMREMILMVAESISSTSSASIEISSSSEQMASGAQEQSSHAGSVAGSIEEMTKTIIENNNNIKNALDSSRQAGLFANQGSEIVNQTITGIERIADVVSEASHTVEELGRSSKKIGDIANVINEIADQTNLLALNAAIEAARAGEHGRGFAVVADEVRKLAERTTRATTEITDMITVIQNDTSGAVKSINSGTNEVKKGKELAYSAGESLEKINIASKKVVDLVTQIASASNQQSASSEDISRNAEGISHVAQESAVGIEQIANAAEDLNRLTDHLQNIMDGFKVNKDPVDTIEEYEPAKQEKFFTI